MSESVIRLILAERRRQVAAGYDAAHDDKHGDGCLGDAAAAYASRPLSLQNPDGDWRLFNLWPFQDGWNPSPGNRVRELVKAGALIVAEIERIQRSQK